jgi:hypothetical protein
LKSEDKVGNRLTDISKGAQPFFELFIELGLDGFSLAGMFVYFDDTAI